MECSQALHTAGKQAVLCSGPPGGEATQMQMQCYSVRFVTVMKLDKKEENREVERRPRGHTPPQ